MAGVGKTTLDVYGHLGPDRDESIRAAVEAVLAARAESLAVQAWMGTPGLRCEILRYSKINVTMEIYTEVPSDATRDALRKPGDWLT